MRPLRTRIRDASVKARVPQTVIEKDYALSYILAGISRQATLQQNLVFKGGTALKKLFFGDYRFSEDLDYSAIAAPKGRNLLTEMTFAGQKAKTLLLEQGPFEVIIRRYEERDPHPDEQDALTFHLQFPWHPSPLCRIKVEISHDEPVLLAPEERRIIHGYEEELEGVIPCYPVTEIVAEKLRTLLQTHQKLTQRGWSRPRARDYYDLWRLFSKYGETIQREKLQSVLLKKCQHRRVTFDGVSDFFTPELLSEAKTHWDGTLGIFVNDLPSLEKVIEELRSVLSNLLR